MIYFQALLFKLKTLNYKIQITSYYFAPTQDLLHLLTFF